MIPTTWSALLDRLAYQLGGRSAGFQAEAEEWVRTAVDACYGVWSLHDLSREKRQLAFQKSAGVLLALEGGEAGAEVALDPDCRARVAAVFARYFDGAVAEGPPWRLSPAENDRPTWEEWSVSADFAGIDDAPVTR